MGSETKPKSHLKSQTKKSQIQNSQKFTMETIFDRFPHLSDDIFEYLDEETLANCVEVDRKWQTTKRRLKNGQKSLSDSAKSGV